MGDIAPSSNTRLPQKVYTETLSHGWTFKQTDDPESIAWLPVKRVPSTVHQDLIDNFMLQDPFIGFNEFKAEWVGEKSWTYRTTFSLPVNRMSSTFESGRHGTKVVLAFDGLDTVATVRLNGETILKADNMFLPYRVDITDNIRMCMTSISLHKRSCMTFELEVEFEPALVKAKEIKAKYPEHKWICSNGDPSRLALRKAQYHWGWDWGPILMCAGIWRDVRLEIFEARISDLVINVQLNEDLSDCVVKVKIETEGWQDIRTNSGIPMCALVKLKCHKSKDVVATRVVDVTSDGTMQAQFVIDKPELWWPAGYGEQKLFDIEATIFSPNNVELHSMVKTIGLRKVELIQELDSHGKSFYFRINNTDIFCGGSCWIPTDSILTNVSAERYRSWIKLMATANQKMIRVWGGGIYEDDAFYSACDEFGILVWQDFMFACGNYPTFPRILASIEAEATANVKRIRHHPSLVLFAGNNEDYQIQEQSGLTYDFADKDEQHWLKTDFPARFIYESLLPKVVAAECPTMPYHPGSPWGDGKITSDPTVGDLHQWNVWHGSQEKYQIFDSLGGRFNSEFGLEAFPHIKTIQAFVERDEDLYPQSRVIDFHNKADGHERRIATYLVENVRTVTGLEAHINMTQVIQSEALTYGYRGWRRQWGDDRKCGGALVWQLNDCWPVTSWSICDYYLRPKLAYYAMARALAPITVGVRREHFDWSVTHARQPDQQKWELWAVSSLATAVEADIELRFISVWTGKQISEPIKRFKVRLAANGTTELDQGIIDNIMQEPHVLAARIWVEGNIVGRDTDWPQPLKYLQFPDQNPAVWYEGQKIHITVDKPLKCFVFEQREGCVLSDNAIDVVPGDEQVINVQKFSSTDAPLRWTFLGSGEQ